MTDKPSFFTRIDVDTNNGVVTLNGIVDTPEQHQLALKVAADTADVIKVSDEIQLRGQAAAPPAATTSSRRCSSDKSKSIMNESFYEDDQRIVARG